MLSLEGKTALITGANRGIGWEIASLFAQYGARPVLNHPTPAPAFPSPLGDLAPDAIAIEADVSSPAAVDAMFAELLQRDVTIDILVNNAGIYPRKDLLSITVEDWDAVLNTNLRGAFLCSQHAARMMRTHGRGRIINIASVAALSGPHLGAHYAASKAGLIAMTKVFARALAADGVLVNAIAPGVIDTLQPALSREQAIERGREIPIGRIGQPADVARVALFLASGLSDYVTGETVLVTGGAYVQ